MITVAYKNIGRNKVCDIIDIDISEKSNKNIITEKIALEAKKFLMSKEVEAIEYEKNKFKIYAGFHLVGKAEIL